jgi:uncharacterized BrkB/YihY/UPF0761 family membrane protein
MSVAIVAALFALIYCIVPDHRLPAPAVWAGSLLVVLLWVYYSAQVTSFGAAVAKALADWTGRTA